jgi:hypothetical protein
MAQVPTYGGPHVEDQVAGTPQLSPNINPGSFAANVLGQAGQEVGGALQQAGGQLFQHALAVQEMANKSASDQAFSQATPAMSQVVSDFTTNVKGTDALKQLPSYVQKIGDIRDSYATEMNPQERSYYDEQTRRYQASMEMQLRSHADEQFKTGVLQNSEAKEHAAVSATNPLDENSVNLMVHTTVNEANNRAIQLYGSSPDQADVRSDYVKSAVMKNTLGILDNLAKASPVQAVDWAKSHQDMIGPQAPVVIQQLQKQALPAYAAIDANTLISQNMATGTSGPRGTVNNNPWNVTVGKTPWEGQVGVDSSNLPPGQAPFAKFASPEAGFNAADKNLAAYGKEGIDTPRAIAERWTGGSASPDYIKAIADAAGVGVDGRIKNLDDPNVRSLILNATRPHETPTTPNSSTQIRANLQSIEAQIPLMAQQRFPGQADLQAEYIDNTTRTVQSRVNQMAAAQRDNEVEQFSGVLDQLIKNNVQSPGQFDPQTSAAYASLPAQYRAEIDSKMNANAKEITPERQENYTKLYNLYLSEKNLGIPTGFDKMTPEQLGDLSQGQMADILKKQSEIKSREQQVNPEMSRAMRNPMTVSAMNALALVPGTSDYNQFAGALMGEMENFSAVHAGKQPGDADISDMVQRLTLSDKNNPSKPTAAFKAIPQAEQTRIIQGYVEKYTSRGLPPQIPSAAKIAEIYWRRNGGR